MRHYQYVLTQDIHLLAGDHTKCLSLIDICCIPLKSNVMVGQRVAKRSEVEMEAQVVLVIIAALGLLLAAVKFGFDLGSHKSKQKSEEDNQG